MMQNEIPEVFVGSATIYRLYFRSSGHAVKVLIDDTSSLLVVVTDHGVVDHQWSTSQETLGAKNITDAISTRWSSGYVANKLLADRGHEFDGKATEKAVIREILNMRRDGQIDKFAAREAYDEILQHQFNGKSWVENAPSSVSDLIDDLYELTQYKPTFLSYLLHELICPALKTELKKAQP